MRPLILVTTILAVSGGFAKADVAVKNATCSQKLNIHHPQGSSGLYFDADCKNAYVLPPSQAIASVTDISQTSNIKQCQALNALLAIEDDEATQMEVAAGIALPSKSNPLPGSGNQNGLIDGILNPSKPPHIETAEERAAKRQLVKDFMGLKSDIDDTIGSFKDVAAASAQITLTIPWDKLVQAYQDTNQIPGVTFQRMPLDSAYLTFDRDISSAGSAPAVLKYTIPGINGNAAGFSDANPGAASQTTITGGDSHQGQLILSLFGACPYYNEDTGELSAATAKSSMTALLTAGFNYSYDLQVYRKYHVEYKLDVLIKHIHESASHGGFFSTSSSVTETNSTSVNDWFSIKNESNDSRFSYELDIPDLKAEAINRAIHDLAIAQGKLPDDLPMVAIRNKDGAQATAEVLQKCPNVYCQAGALALQALDAIFGSASASSVYTNSQQALVTEDISDNKTYRFFGASSFATAKSGFTFGN